MTRTIFYFVPLAVILGVLLWLRPNRDLPKIIEL